MTDEARPGRHGPLDGVPPEIMVTGAAATQVLAHIARGEQQQARSCLGLLLLLGNFSGLYLVCETWAEVVAAAMVDTPRGTFTSLEIFGPDGRQIDPSDLPEEMAPTVWAARFVTASFNSDEDTMLALYASQVRAARLDGVEALAAMASAVVYPGGEQ